MSAELAVNFLSSRFNFPPGEQVKVTPRIQEIANQFASFQHMQQFELFHKWIFSTLKVLPYEESDLVTVEDEARRRWKLTADELVQVGTLYDGKYCNDVVSLFNSGMTALGYEARVAKVFKPNDKNEIIVHSISLVKTQHDSFCAINSGSEKFYWVEELSDESPVQIRDWNVWKIGKDQWAMGLTDSSQENSTIIAYARNFLGLK